jgi:RNA polymerase sigma factor (sigma-70 family)
MTPATDAAMTGSRNSAITRAVNYYGRQLLSFIRGRVPNVEDAEDILQDVWYQLSRVPSLDEIDSLSGWLYRVAKNRITDSQRKKQPDLLDDMAYESEDGEVSFRDLLLAVPGQDPALDQLRELFWLRLKSALDELPEKQRLVFIENEIHEKTLQTIAKEQGENLKTIISRKGYAVKHLRERLSSLYQSLNER